MTVEPDTVIAPLLRDTAFKRVFNPMPLGAAVIKRLPIQGTGTSEVHLYPLLHLEEYTLAVDPHITRSRGTKAYTAC